MVEAIITVLVGLVLLLSMAIVVLDHIRCPYCGSLNLKRNVEGVDFCRRCRRFIV
jgi:ribosomal protein L37AE/L43A